MNKKLFHLRMKPLAAGLIIAGLVPLPALAQIRADIRPSLVAQLGQTVEKVSRKVAGIPEVTELENAERPLVLLQVFDNRSVVYAKPDKDSRAIGEFFKGQLVDAFEEKNGWYRIRIQDSLLGSTDGWIQQGSGQFGEQAWFYVSQNTRQSAFRRPRTENQAILRVRFDAAGNVAGVDRAGSEKIARLDPDGLKRHFGIAGPKDQVGLHLLVKFFLHRRGNVDLCQNSKALVAKGLAGAGICLGKADPGQQTVECVTHRGNPFAVTGANI